jgi:hypothetical protein
MNEETEQIDSTTPACQRLRQGILSDEVPRANQQRVSMSRRTTASQIRHSDYRPSVISLLTLKLRNLARWLR